MRGAPPNPLEAPRAWNNLLGTSSGPRVCTCRHQSSAVSHKECFALLHIRHCITHAAPALTCNIMPHMNGSVEQTVTQAKCYMCPAYSSTAVAPASEARANEHRQARCQGQQVKAAAQDQDVSTWQSKRAYPWGRCIAGHWVTGLCLYFFQCSPVPWRT